MDSVKKIWWENISNEPEGGMKLNYAVAINGLLVQSIAENKIIFNESYNGKLIKGDWPNIVEKMIAELKLTEVLEWYGNGTLYSRYFVSDTSYMESTERNNNFHLVTNDPEIRSVFVKICKEHIEKAADRKGAVNVLVQGSNSLYLSTIGVGGLPLSELNYSDKVVDQYNKVVADTKLKNPTGRITILTGEPGTGKTHLVRALLNDCTNATFVFIPSYMVANLNAPQLIPVLSEEAEKDKPIFIVIEDADSCLVKRQADNFSEVSTLLNLGDGILGSILDIRILCTTNAKQLEIDPALKRNGRLCQLIEVGKLSVQKANNLLNNLVLGDTTSTGTVLSFSFEKEVTLADVYAKAKELGWEEK